MRTVISVRIARDYEERSEAIIRHLRIQGDRLGQIELRELYDDIPIHVREATGSAVAGPDHEAILEVLSDHHLEVRTAVFGQAADALSLMCQATRDELKFDRIVGAFSLGFNTLFDVNGLISHGPPHQLQLRLRAQPQHLYRATEQLLKEIAQVDRELRADDFTVVSKERGQDEVAARAEIRLLRREKRLRLLKDATAQRIVDPGVWWVLFVAIIFGCLSWLDHFHPALLHISRWKEADVTWLDGWLGRLASAALFAAGSALLVLTATIRRVFAEQDGIYMTVNWS